MLHIFLTTFKLNVLTFIILPKNICKNKISQGLHFLLTGRADIIFGLFLDI